MKPLSPASILVVDDDVDHAYIARIVLQSIVPAVPIEVRHAAANAFDALLDLPRGSLVLIDRVLDDAESFDTIVRMRAERPDVAIVLLSAALSSVDRAYAIACGAFEAIEKPSGLDGWRRALGALLSATTPPDPPTAPACAGTMTGVRACSSAA